MDGAAVREVLVAYCRGAVRQGGPSLAPNQLHGALLAKYEQLRDMAHDDTHPGGAAFRSGRCRARDARSGGVQAA